MAPLVRVPPTNRGRKLPVEPLTPVEVEALLAATSGRTSAGIRLRALIAVLYGAGLRLAETLSLRPADVDTETCSVRVREGKGRRSRTVGIDRHSATVLQRWLDRRPQLGLAGRHSIFATYETGKIPLTYVGPSLS